MFDLEKAIADWRRGMLAAGIKTPTPLEELESHLREDVERKIHAGMGVEQAFHCAVHGLGLGDGLQREFEKLEDAKRLRARELLRRWSVIVGTAFVYALMSWTWWLGVRQGKFVITPLEILFAAGAAVPMLLLGQLGPHIARRLPVLHENGIVAITLAVLFLGALLFRCFFPEISPVNIVHLQIAMLWCLSPLPGVGGCASAWAQRCQTLRKSNLKQTA